MAATLTPHKLMVDLRNNFEKLKNQLVKSNNSNHMLEILKEQANELLLKVPKEKDATNLNAEIQGFLYEINRKLNALAPSAPFVKREEKKATSSLQNTSAPVENVKQVEALKAKRKTTDEELANFYADNIMIMEGTLKEAILTTVALNPVLTLQEEREINRAKDNLSFTAKELEYNKELYRKALQSGGKNLTGGKKLRVTVIVKKKSDNADSPGTEINIEEHIKNLKKDGLHDINFLSRIASKLLSARQYKRAQMEFQSAIGYSKQINGLEDAETLKIQLDYGIALLSDGMPESAIPLIEGPLEKLEKQLLDLKAEGPATIDVSQPIKRSMAIGYYNLAQYHLQKGNIELATKCLDSSERLRKEYGASEEELDRVKFLRGRILYKDDKKPEAKKMLMQCYKFRMAQNELNSNLIPVLEVLSNIMEAEHRLGKQFSFLRHLLMIQKSLHFSEISIIETQLKILKAAAYQVSNREYWEMMEDTKKRLDTIPIRKESEEVGQLYLQLASTRINSILPEEWSNVKKRDYFFETSSIIARAERHLLRNTNGSALTALKILKDKVLAGINTYEEMEIFFTDQKMHPEDAAELALSNTPGDMNNGHESSTLERLAALSTFSSEVNYSLVAESDRVLEIEEFNSLPDEGTINPYRLRISQGEINSTFRDERPLETMRDLLTFNPKYRNEIPPVEIGIDNGKVYSFDTRRLVVHMKAKEINPEVLIRYKKISGDYLQKRIEAIASPRPWEGFVTAVRYGGVNSHSIPYINPAVRSQLEEEVNKAFKSFPQDRKLSADNRQDDENGFPIVKKGAKKIYKFFENRAKKGSEHAKEILKEAEKIHNTKGKDACYNYLIHKKESLKIVFKMRNKGERDEQPKAELLAAKTVSRVNIAEPTAMFSSSEASYQNERKQTEEQKKEKDDDSSPLIFSKKRLDLYGDLELEEGELHKAVGSSLAFKEKLKWLQNKWFEESYDSDERRLISSIITRRTHVVNISIIADNFEYFRENYQKKYEGKLEKALKLACLCGSKQITEFLLTQLGVDYSTNGYDFLLGYACASSNQAWCKEIAASMERAGIPMPDSVYGYASYDLIKKIKEIFNEEAPPFDFTI